MRAFFFTMHRSGSMVLHRTLLHAARTLEAPLIAPNAGGHMIPLRELARRKDEIVFPERFICGALRGFIPFPGLASAKVLLHVRDPRDVLTSMFYSYCYSHQGKQAGDTGHRREVAERGIDWFVLHMSEADRPDLVGDYGTGNSLTDLFGNVRKRYLDYLERLAPLPQTTILKYEDMILRPDDWIAKVNEALGLTDVSPLRDLIGGDDPAAAPAEDKWSHRRQALPGDHRRKLSDGAIQRLNDLYAPVLQGLGYA